MQLALRSTMPRQLLPHALFGLSLLAAACADAPAAELTQPSLEPSTRAWVTTDRAAASVLQAELPRLAAGLREQPSGLMALELERAELPELSEVLHQKLSRCPGFMLEDSFEAAAGAPPPASAGALQVVYSIDNAATVAALQAPLSESKLRDAIQQLSDFPTRLHDSPTGKEASLWIRDRWQAYAQPRADAKVELINHKGTPQPSVALTIRGSKYPEQLVVLGGHLDSINQRGGLAPGADDNASGIAVLDDVARSALTLGYQPERTVIFYAYAAEEIGLVGSAEIAKAAADAKLDVVAALQLDMTNYNPAPAPYVSIITDFTDPTLNQLARQLVEKYVGVPWKDSECGYACSDHGSWNKRGFPVHYVHESITEESNDQIHTAKDTLALSNGSAAHSLYFARYAAAFMAEVAKGSLPPPAGTGGAGGAGGAAVAGAPPSAGGVGGAATGGVGGAAVVDAVSAGNAGIAGASASSGAGQGGAVGLGGAGLAPSAGSPSVALPAGPAVNLGDAEGCACRLAPPHEQSARSLFPLLVVAVVMGRKRRRARVARTRTCSCTAS